MKRPPDQQASQKKRQCTNFNTILLNTNVVDLDDSDDDDIQVIKRPMCCGMVIVLVIGKLAETATKILLSLFGITKKNITLIALLASSC